MISLVGPQNPLLTQKLSDNLDSQTGTILLKRGFAHMLKHGVIMDVTDVNQAQIAEEAGAVAVWFLINYLLKYVNLVELHELQE